MHDSFNPAIKLTSEKFDRIPGLRLLRQGLSHRIQTRLLDTIIEANYFNNATTNQAMHFGDLPKAFEDIGTWARENTDLLVDINRDRLFDQAILNLYRPGEGIRSHVDLQKFDDGILIVSLLSSCVMVMTAASESLKQATSYQEEGDLEDGIPILLKPGDVLAMVGPARWDWAHCIPARHEDIIDGELIQRGARVSITLRKLRSNASEDKDQTASPSEQTSIAAASSSSNASTTLGNPAQVAPEELVTSSQFPTNTSDCLASRNNPSNALSTTPQFSSVPTAMSSKSKPRSKKSSKGASLLSLLLCCTFGSGSLLDDKDGSRGGDRSDSEPQTERVLDTNQADSMVTAASTMPPQRVSNRDELHTAPAQETGAPADAPIPLRPMTTDQKPLLPPLANEHEDRKCLVLDLDETLIHSSFKFISNPDYIVPVEIENQYHNVYVLKRPGVDEFLRKMGELYEIVVFTASVAKYADPVLDILDIHKVISHRLCRDSCYNHKGNYVKDLSQLGRDLSSTLILDNSPASYIFHTSNAVPVSTWFNDPHDTELTDLIGFLTDLTAVDDVTQVLDTVIGTATDAGSLNLSTA
ncbi:unnamed protein product [Umbelopsis vinacea]